MFSIHKYGGHMPFRNMMDKGLTFFVSCFSPSDTFVGVCRSSGTDSPINKSKNIIPLSTATTNRRCQSFILLFFVVGL